MALRDAPAGGGAPTVGLAGCGRAARRPARPRCSRTRTPTRSPSRAAEPCWRRRRTDLEPIVLAHDPDPEVAEPRRPGPPGPPTMEVQDADGVAAPAVAGDRRRRLLDRLTAALARTEAVIADGHHRFAAARAHAAHCERRCPGSDARAGAGHADGPRGAAGGRRSTASSPSSIWRPPSRPRRRASRVTDAVPPGGAGDGRRRRTRWLADAGRARASWSPTARRLVRLDRSVRGGAGGRCRPRRRPPGAGSTSCSPTTGCSTGSGAARTTGHGAHRAHRRRGAPAAADRGGVALLLRAAFAGRCRGGGAGGCAHAAQVHPVRAEAPNRSGAAPAG